MSVVWWLFLERLQTKTKRFTRLSYTGLVVELEHLEIKTRLTNEKFASVMCVRFRRTKQVQNLRCSKIAQFVRLEGTEFGISAWFLQKVEQTQPTITLLMSPFLQLCSCRDAKYVASMIFVMFTRTTCASSSSGFSAKRTSFLSQGPPPPLDSQGSQSTSGSVKTWFQKQEWTIEKRAPSTHFYQSVDVEQARQKGYSVGLRRSTSFTSGLSYAGAALPGEAGKSNRQPIRYSAALPRSREIIKEISRTSTELTDSDTREATVKCPRKRTPTRSMSIWAQLIQDENLYLWHHICRIFSLVHQTLCFTNKKVVRSRMERCRKRKRNVYYSVSKGLFLSATRIASL